MQGTLRAANRLFCRGVDQVRYGLGLRQVHFPVEISAFAKLAGRRHPRTQGETAFQQLLQHHRPAVPLKLQHVFAGIGIGSGKKQSQPLIDGDARLVAEIT